MSSNDHIQKAYNELFVYMQSYMVIENDDIEERERRIKIEKLLNQVKNEFRKGIEEEFKRQNWN